MTKPATGNNKLWPMMWIMLFLIMNANILAGAAVYRIFLSPATTEMIDPIDQKALALHRDYIILEQHQITLSKQLNRCLYRQL